MIPTRATGLGTLLLALAAGLPAQRPRQRADPPPAPVPQQAGLPEVQPIPWLGVPGPAAWRPFSAPPVRGGFPFYPPAPAYFDGRPSSQNNSNTNTNIVIVQPAAVVPAPAPPPPEPIRSVLIEPGDSRASASSPSASARPFVLVDRTGAEHLAMAVVVLSDAVSFVDPANRHRRMPLGDIDFDKTHQANRARDLVLRLPAP